MNGKIDGQITTQGNTRERGGTQTNGKRNNEKQGQNIILVLQAD